MEKFNPENKGVLTYGECLEPAMEITGSREAKQYLADYIKYQESNMPSVSDGQTAEEICKSNLGYWAGYYHDRIRKRVERLFACQHPIFGSFKKNGRATGKEAFECGRTGQTLDEIRS